MQMRPLGRSGLSIAPLVLGGNVFGWTADEATSHSILDAFVDAGFNAIDTADTYSRWAPGNKGGESETIIGTWLKSRGRRDRVTILTKVGMEMVPDAKGLSKAHIIRSVEGSLKRLQSDHIDLYQAHKDDPTAPLEETLGAFESLIKTGKVRAIGASNYSAERLGEALATGRRLGIHCFETLQPEYNLYDRAGYEAALEPLCRKEDLGVIPYFSLASGFLTGKYRQKKDFAQSVRGEDMGSYLNPRGLRILAALDDVAARHHSKPAAVALAWLMARPGLTAPIASATSISQLATLASAVRLVLSAKDIAALDRASTPDPT
jgi:aryl-alcohol dehydrogenase-like predicted oxidoreductase